MDEESSTKQINPSGERTAPSHKQSALWRGWVAAVVLFAALALLHGGRPLIKGEVPPDERYIHLPNCALTIQCVREGSLPTWNPYVFSGLPHLASHHAAALYPPVYAFFGLFSPLRAFSLMQAFHYFMMGLGMWALLRWGWRLRQIAALAGGAFFMLSGFTIAHEPHSPMIWAIAWIPWMLLLSRRTLEGRRWAGPLLAIAIACQIAAGYMQVSVMTWIVMGLEAVFVNIDRHKKHEKTRKTHYIAWIGAMVLGVGLQSVQFIATLEMLPYTFRESIDFAAFISHSLPPAQLATVVFPLLFGAEYPFIVGQSYFGAWPGDQPELVGAMSASVWIGMLLLILGRTMTRRRLRPDLRRGVWFWSIATILCFTLVLGKYSPLSYLLFHMPVLKLFRVQTRWMLFMDMGLAILAAVGVDRLARAAAREARLRLRAPLIAGTVLILGSIPLVYIWLRMTLAASDSAIDPAWFFGSVFSMGNPALWMPVGFGLLSLGVLWTIGRRPRWIALGVMIWIGLAAIEQGILCAHVTNRFTRPSAWATPPENQSAAWMLRDNDGQTGTFRAVAPTGPNIRLNEETLLYHLGALSNIYMVGGYWPLVSPVYTDLLRMTHLTNFLDLDGLLRRTYLLSMLNVKYLLIGHRFDLADRDSWEGAHPANRMVDELLGDGRYPQLTKRHQTDSGTTILENTAVLDRAWMVNRIEPVLSPRGAIARLWSEPAAFDAAREALVQSFGLAPLPQTADLSSGSVSIVARKPDRLWMTVNSPDGPGFVVLSEAWYPGWWCRVAPIGQEPSRGAITALYRTNAMLRGFFVPQGNHAVYMRYLPTGLKYGIYLSLFFGGVWGVWVLPLIVTSGRSRSASPRPT